MGDDDGRVKKIGVSIDVVKRAFSEMLYPDKKKSHRTYEAIVRKYFLTSV